MYLREGSAQRVEDLGSRAVGGGDGADDEILDGEKSKKLGESRVAGGVVDGSGVGPRLPSLIGGVAFLLCERSVASERREAQDNPRRARR